MNIVGVILSILLGMIPEVTFFTLFLIYVKNIKDKKIKLWILMAINYIAFIMIFRHKIICYILFLIFTYIILKILYKQRVQIIDIFVFDVGYIYICFISYICFYVVGNNIIIYFIMLLINRILLFIPFIFRNKFNSIYKKYCSLWNRNYQKKQPIKSITLRNISLISLNIFIFICNIVCLYILSLKR